MSNITLLKNKIEGSIKVNKAIVVTISSPLIECRNTIYTDNYEFDGTFLHLECDNYELHINISEMEVDFDESYDDEFILFDEERESEIKLDFLN